MLDMGFRHLCSMSVLHALLAWKQPHTSIMPTSRKQNCMSAQATSHAQGMVPFASQLRMGRSGRVGVLASLDDKALHEHLPVMPLQVL